MKKALLPYFKSILVLAVITLASEFVRRRIDPINVVMLYLLGIVIVATRWGRGPVILTSVLSVAVFDFFIIPPSFNFVAEDPQHIFTVAGLLVIGLVISGLTLKMKEQSQQLSLQESRAAALKLQTALLHSVSHDLRTPLASITGSLSTLIENGDSLDANARGELLENTYEESNRLNRRVGNLLDVTRAEAGALKIDVRPCDLRDVIGVSLKEMKCALGAKTVLIDARGLPEVPMDFTLMVKVFNNLIDNTVKYSPETSPLRFAASAAAGRARIEISDEGRGISPAELEKVFDKFYRAPDAGRSEGVGLGLFLCKCIVEAHGGEIRAENNRAGKGVTFVISLPAKEVSFEKV